MFTLYVIWMLFSNLSKKKNPTYEASYEWERPRLEENNFKMWYDTFDEPYKTIEIEGKELPIYVHGDKNSDKTVVFVHGIKCTYLTVVKVLDYYLSRGYNVISFDHRGYGKSDKFGKNTLGNKEAHFVKHVIDFAKEEFKDNKIILHGESMGGGTVYSYIGKYGHDSVDAIIADAGFNSQVRSLINIAKTKISFLANLLWLTLPWILPMRGIRARRFVKKKDLAKIDNMIHLHSKNDHLVSYKVVNELPENINVLMYSNPDVRHVRGWYYAKEELYQYLDNKLPEILNK